MALNVFGQYVVPATGRYVIELMARRTGTSQVVVDNPEIPLPCKNDHGQIIVEHYRSYASVSAAYAMGAKFPVNTDRAAFLPGDIVVGEERLLPRTSSFNVAEGDVLRLQGAATAQLILDAEDPDASVSLFFLSLRLGGGSDVAPPQPVGCPATYHNRFAGAMENLTPDLLRFTLQNDGLYVAPQAARVDGYQSVSYHRYSLARINAGANTDLVAMHFANRLNGEYLASSQQLTAVADLVFPIGSAEVELFTFSDQHRAGDILRVQGQAELEMVSGETGAACWARIEIYENGAREYLSMFDQRFIRNSSESDRDYDSGTFAPFALYTTQQSDEHNVRLIVKCNATKPADIRAKYYGRGLMVDHFTRVQ